MQLLCNFPFADAFKNDIISGSEDKTLAVWDIRSRSVVQKMTLGKLCYPNCSHMDSGLLYVGDNRGSIHVISTNDGRAQKITTFETGHQKAISYVKHGRGYLLTSSLDGSIRISIPTNPPHAIATVLSSGGEVGGVSVLFAMKEKRILISYKMKNQFNLVNYTF